MVAREWPARDDAGEPEGARQGIAVDGGVQVAVRPVRPRDVEGERDGHQEAAGNAANGRRKSMAHLGGRGTASQDLHLHRLQLDPDDAQRAMPDRGVDKADGS